MSLEEDLSEIKAALEHYSMAHYVEIDEGVLFYRHDTYDTDCKEQWTEYCDVEEILKEIGWGMVEPYIEHDCISSELRRITSQPLQ